MENNLSVVFRRLNVNDQRPQFDCGDSDLNEFFIKDSIQGCEQLVSVTYAVEREGELLAFFCVSNDAIRAEDTSKNKYKKILSGMPSRKKYPSMPAVKIGRLATISKMQGNGIGTKILDLIKMWFSHGNKTGCRFIIVDAKNKPEILKFYNKNGFEFLDNHSASEKEHTRLMFFDLFTFKK